MQYEDRMTISTPEGVTMEVTLAGVGSRGAAMMIDAAIQSIVFIVAFTILVARYADSLEGSFEFGTDRPPSDALLGLALFNIVLFVVFFFYNVIFETIWSGRTPGKKSVGLRVVRLDGGPVDFKTVAVRNLLRIVDLLPVNYGVGIVSILATSNNQRVGDLVAGTVVVREPGAKEKKRKAPGTVMPPQPPPSSSEVSSWDVSGVTQQELSAVRSFLDRRHELNPQSRASIAAELAARLRTKVPGAAAELHPETFLERLAAAKTARG